MSGARRAVLAEVVLGGITAAVHFGSWTLLTWLAAIIMERRANPDYRLPAAAREPKRNPCHARTAV